MGLPTRWLPAAQADDAATAARLLQRLTPGGATVEPIRISVEVVYGHAEGRCQKTAEGMASCASTTSGADRARQVTG